MGQHFPLELWEPPRQHRPPLLVVPMGQQRPPPELNCPMGQQMPFEFSVSRGQHRPFESCVPTRQQRLMVGSAQKRGTPRTRVVGQQDFPQGMEPTKQMGKVVTFNGAPMTLLARKRMERRKKLCMVIVYVGS
jgi:hypothetical protein